MENSKLMTPLFYGVNFNREGRKMRAVLEREISDGTTTYRLWRSAGIPDLDYPRAENDKYILHVEINGYLAPLGMTDFALVDLGSMISCPASRSGMESVRACGTFAQKTAVSHISFLSLWMI